MRIRVSGLLISLSLVSAILLPVPPAYSAAGTVGSGNCQSSVGETSYYTASTSGNFCVLTFKASDSTLTITSTWTAPFGVREVKILVVGGGGGGGTDLGGGGGGGRVIETTTTVTPGSAISLTAGKGGAPGNGTFSTNSSLNNTGGYTGASSTFGSITALGGSGAIGRTKGSGNGTAAGWDFTGWTGGGGGYQVSSVTSGVSGAAFGGGVGG